MSFTSKNLQSARNGMSFIKGATLFFLGISFMLFVANAFEIIPVARNAVQYIGRIFLTTNGDSSSAVGIQLDGGTTGGITITNLSGSVILGTDGSGKITTTTSGAVYNFISGYALSGPTGAAGTGGATGPAGVDGADGLDGATGPMGPQGPAGADGVDGLDGATGPMGPQGPAGGDGADGAPGLDGATGPMGPQGPAGSDGAVGATGADGAVGATGANGADGADGATGAAGATGTDGADGIGTPGGITGSIQYNYSGSLSGWSDVVISGGNLGIGQYYPGQKLEVYGNIKLSIAGYMEAGTNPNQLYFGTDGRIGVGTNNPRNTLDVAGDIKIDSSNSKTNNSGFMLAYSDYYSTGVYKGLIQTKQNGSYVDLTINPYAPATAGFMGIGTGSALYKLDVNGTGRFTNDLLVGGSLGVGTGAGLGFDMYSSSTGKFFKIGFPYGRLFFGGDQGSFGGADVNLSMVRGNSSYSQQIAMYDTDGISSLFRIGADINSKYSIISSGNMYIGTTNGNITINPLFNGEWDTPTNDLVITTGHQVGIGTNTPSAALTVSGSVVVTGGGINVYDTPRASAQYKINNKNVLYDDNDGNLMLNTYWNSGRFFDYTGVFIGAKNSIAFALQSGNFVMTITGDYNTGKVGIGTQTPTAKLTVEGGIKAKLRTTDPCGATDYPPGTMFYTNTGAGFYCYCNDAGDAIRMNGNTECISGVSF